ncbi:hypothetical protein TGRH88_042000 [Toxoplasma gondii]|uniref:Uncharacterized protein n=1 Tax=Toxoplasma gondii TaxID=5811 RepID=A0A7J6JYL9_TOXGO|nr:hypothetical protein TGRH88_042000 [Toxoplasma gondii]
MLARQAVEEKTGKGGVFPRGKKRETGRWPQGRNSAPEFHPVTSCFLLVTDFLSIRPLLSLREKSCNLPSRPRTLLPTLQPHLSKPSLTLRALAC